MKRIGIVAGLLFIATVFGANWAIQHYGLVSVGFGLAAPAGVYFAGLAFTLRDVLHRTLGRAAVIAAITVGALASYLVSPTFAGASAAAFLLSETADLLVYEPISRRSFLGGVVLSNIVGSVVDSALFLWLAYGSLAFIQGQIIGKSWMTLAALPVVFALRRTLAPAR